MGPARNFVALKIVCTIYHVLSLDRVVEGPRLESFYMWKLIAARIHQPSHLTKGWVV